MTTDIVSVSSGAFPGNDITTDEQLKLAVKSICRRCNHIESDEEAKSELKRLIKEELGHKGTPAVTTTSTSSGRMHMRMFMVMLFGPSGNIVSV